MRLLIVACSTRPGRRGFPIALWTEQMARAHDAFEVEFADLRDVGLPIFDEPNHPRLKQYEHGHTRRWSAMVEPADAFVFVTPEYNHAYPASLKNAIDFLHNEWKYKPAGFVSYGGIAAGTRCVQAIKPVLDCMHMVPVYEGVNVPFFTKLIDEEGVFHPDKALEDAAVSMFDRLAFWANHNAPLFLR